MKTHVSLKMEIQVVLLLLVAIVQHKCIEESIHFHVIVTKNRYFLISREYCFLSISNFNRVFLRISKKSIPT